MLAKRIIPCLDVDRGRVVKGTNFVNLRDAGDPVEVAARYEEEGADELVFLDITASHEGAAIILDVVRRTAEVCFMPLTVGGGIRTLDDIRALLKAGADKVSINSAAVSDPEFVRQAARRVRQPVHRRQHRPASGSSATAARSGRSTSTAAGCRRAWRRSPGPARSSGSGAGEIVLTSMDADGTKDGYDLEMTRAVADAVEIPVVASGGAGEPEHLRAALTEGRADAALAASIFHYREYHDRRDQGVPGRARRAGPPSSPSRSPSRESRRVGAGPTRSPSTT